MDALSDPSAPVEPPDPEERVDDSSSGAKPKSKRSRQAAPLPTREEIIHKLATLPRLLLMGLVTPAIANSIRAALHTLLQAMAPGGGGSRGAGPSFEANAAKWREALMLCPEIGEDLAQFMGPEVIDQLFEEPPGDQP